MYPSNCLPWTHTFDLHTMEGVLLYKLSLCIPREKQYSVPGTVNPNVLLLLCVCVGSETNAIGK